MIAGAAATAVAPVRPLRASEPAVRFGLTPVLLTSDLDLLEMLRLCLEAEIGRAVRLVTRRTYQEITTLLVSGQLDAAWICGYPFVRFRDRLALVAVPVWRGRPLYQSYLIVGAGRAVADVSELRGDVHAFSDPDSNSGFLVTQALIAARWGDPRAFFRKSFFTYGHRNVARAVAAGLADSGSIDGYVWEVLSEVEPAMIGATRVLHRSDWLGFPPVACARGVADAPVTHALRAALTGMSGHERGRAVLRELRLDAFVAGDPALYDGIAATFAAVRDYV